jgi:hypothetical protein
MVQTLRFSILDDDDDDDDDDADKVGMCANLSSRYMVRR